MAPPRILPQPTLLSANTNFGNNYKNHNSSFYEKSATSCPKNAALSDQNRKRLTFLQCKKPIERTTFQTLRKYKNKLTTAQKLTTLAYYSKLSSNLTDILTESLGSIDVTTLQNPSKGVAREQNPTHYATGHTLLRTTTPDSRTCELAENFSASRTEPVNDRNSVSLVREFLESIGLQKYVNNFEHNGLFTDLDLQLLEEQDLHVIGVQSREDRELILKSVTQFLSSERVALLKWLQMYQLSELWNQLWNLGIQSLSQLYQARNSSREELSSLGVRTYGVQKRFKLCCQNLESYLSSTQTLANNSSQNSPDQNQPNSPISQQSTKPEHTKICDPNPSLNPGSISDGSPNASKLRVSEKTVAVGYWAKPQSLKGATSDFLCVQAAIRGTSDVTSPAYQLEFMVDSGSDVVTCRPEVLHKLGAKLLGRIESRGIHATVEKEIYRGYLQLGGQVVPVEVMPENYESIGNQVMKHFKHYITNNNHFWLSNQQQQQ